MVVTSRRRGWTQKTRCCSHLEQTRPTRRVVTLIWSRQAFEVLLIGSGDGSSRISASACERWQKGVGHTTTGLSHSLRVLVVLGCGWGAADRPLGSAVRMCERSKKTDPLRIIHYVSQHRKGCGHWPAVRGTKLKRKFRAIAPWPVLEGCVECT